jgi:hypothetical protein
MRIKANGTLPIGVWFFMIFSFGVVTGLVARPLVDSFLNPPVEGDIFLRPDSQR